jgi:hypothetical protein
MGGTGYAVRLPLSGCGAVRQRTGLGDQGSAVQIRPARPLETLAAAGVSPFLDLIEIAQNRAWVPLWVPLQYRFCSITSDMLLPPSESSLGPTPHTARILVTLIGPHGRRRSARKHS